jgi:hypothetical protein
MEVNILLKYIRCQEKGKYADIPIHNGVENVAAQKPITVSYVKQISLLLCNWLRDGG